MIKLITERKKDLYDPAKGNSLVLYSGQSAVGRPTGWRPTRLLTLSDGENLALLLGFRQWRIWSDDEENGQCISEAYAAETDAETGWQKLCAELTAPIQKKLAARLRGETDDDLIVEILSELTRLEIADDNSYSIPNEDLRDLNPALYDEFMERQGEVTSNGN